jgi:uncharacterized protein YjbI with pentapeptide repeats
MATKAGKMTASKQVLQERWTIEPARTELLRSLVDDRKVPEHIPRHAGRADLRGAPLKEADLEGIAFEGADLSFADMTGARLCRAGLWKAELSGATLDRADLTMANLMAVRLAGASLRETILARADANGAFASGAVLDGAELTSANLENADLRSAFLRRARLRDTYFQGASLERVDLSLAELQAAHLQKACLLAANLRGANLANALLGRASLEGAFLAGANLAGADLRGTSLRHAYLHDAVLSGTLLTGAKLDDGVGPTHILLPANRLRLEEAMVALLLPRVGIAEIRSLGQRLMGLSLENTESVPDAVKWLLQQALSRGKATAPEFNAPRGPTPAAIRAGDLQALLPILERGRFVLDDEARALIREVSEPDKPQGKHVRAALQIFELLLQCLLHDYAKNR